MNETTDASTAYLDELIALGRLWKLRPAWETRHRFAEGFAYITMANSEEEARQMAREDWRDEFPGQTSPSFWLEQKLSICDLVREGDIVVLP